MAVRGKRFASSAAVIATIVVTVAFFQLMTHFDNGVPSATETTATENLGNRSRSLANLSLQLNDIQRELQQLVCRGDGPDVSDTGGWCARPVASQHRTDLDLAQSLAILFFGRTVASFGEGLGQYQRTILSTGFVDRFDAFDGSPFIEELTEGSVRFLDLAIPQFWLNTYDWTMSLEVMEHIPSNYESTALDNICRPARLGVVLSWAIPGQGGFGHVNRRSADYVDEQMLRRGFLVDVKSSTQLRDASTFAWFKFTLNVYRRTNESLRIFDWQTREP